MTPDEARRPTGSPDTREAAALDEAEIFDQSVSEEPILNQSGRPGGLEEAVEAFDRAVEEAFDRLRGNPVADRVLYTASELGNFSILWHVLAWSGAVSKRGRRHALRVSAALALESALVNGPVKSAFNRSRPLAEHDHPHRLRQPLTSSFPSGHASAAVVAAALLSESRRRRWPLWAMASAVAASRVHVRIHHASDVAVGALVGAVLARLFKKIWPLR